MAETVRNRIKTALRESYRRKYPIKVNKQNLFYQHRDEIGDISVERSVDLGVATSMWMHEKGYSHGDINVINQVNEWYDIMRKFQVNSYWSLADLFDDDDSDIADA